jgi:hypothetical protein
LEEDYDAVIVYDGEDSNAPILANLSGSGLPNVITSTYGVLYMEFLSDTSIRKSGWKATYSSEQKLGLDNGFLKNIMIYPNPVSKFLIIEKSSPEAIKITITDMLGRKFLKTHELIEGENKIDIKSLTPGFYLVNFRSDKMTFSHKILVE